MPLGAPGDLKFWAPNRGLLTVEGNDTIPRGIYSWDGQSWHQLATVCGGPGDTARIAWAGPDEFWVVSEPSLPRRGSGLALCRFKDGQVVGSWSTRVDAADPFRQMLSATCNGPDDCWFGGVGSQDALGERVGAFHLHWNGSDLESVYGPQGRGVSDMEFHQGSALREHPGRPLAREPRRAGRPRRTGAGAAPDPPRSPARLRQRPVPAGPAGSVPADGTRAARARRRREAPTSGPSGAAPPRAPRPAGRRGRAPAAGGAPGRRAFEELPLTSRSSGQPTASATSRRSRRTNEALATVVPFADRHSANSKAIVARIAADGTTTTTRLPAAGAGRGSAARIACPAQNECWMVTWGGWLFHYSDGTPLPRDTDPAFQGTIDFRPNEAAEQFVPDRLPVDDSQLLRAAAAAAGRRKPRNGKVKRLPPLLRRIGSQLRGLRLAVSFTVTRRARVALIAKRGARTVARTPPRVLPPGRHSLTLQLSRDRYPTRLAFKTKEVKRK